MPSLVCIKARFSIQYLISSRLPDILLFLLRLRVSPRRVLVQLEPARTLANVASEREARPCSVRPF